MEPDWRRPFVARNRKGRPPALTPRVAAAIIQSVQATNKKLDAAKAAGISTEVFGDWLKKGRDDRHDGRHSIYRDFANSLETAEAESKERLVNIIAAAADESPEHAKWLLSMKYPAEYSPRVQVVVDNELRTALVAIREVVDADTFDRIIDAVQIRGSGAGVPQPAIVEATRLLPVDSQGQPTLQPTLASEDDLRQGTEGGEAGDGDQ